MKTKFIIYSLTLLLSLLAAAKAIAAAQTGQIDYGMTVEEILTSRMPAHTWMFQGSEGDVITIEMEAVSDPDFTSLDTLLILEFEDGTILAEDNDGGAETDARIESFQLPADGDYVIIATSFSGEESGRYRLHLNREDRLSRRIEYAGQLTYGERVEGGLAPDVAAQVWEFLGDEGDEISIAMNALTGELDTFLLLLRVDERELEELFSLSQEELVELDAVTQERGLFLDGNDDRGEDRNSLISPFVLPADGPYAILATSCCTAESSGPYELMLDFNDSQAPVAPGGGQSQPSTAVPQVPPAPPTEPPSRIPYGVLILVFIVSGVVMWRWIRPRPSLPKESPEGPSPVPSDVQFKLDWDAPSYSVDAGGKGLKFNIDIRFELGVEQRSQDVEGYDASLIG